MFFEKPIKEIEESDIERLMELEIPEDKNLEYKGDFNTDDLGHKRTLLKTVSAFSNTSGGLLIYGIDEEEGIPSELKGIEVDNKDQLGRWLEEYIRGNSEPKISSIDVEFIDKTNSDNSFILVKVPRSWNLPHKVTMGPKTKKFFIRRGRYSEEMDISDLRTAFNFSETLAEQIKRFREERISSILSDETPIPLKKGAKIVIHIIPINAFYPGLQYDIEQIYSDNQFRLRAIDAYSPKLRYNFDGLLGSELPDNEGLGSTYVQLYRNGIIEATNGDFFNDEHKIMSDGYYEKIVVKSVTEYLEIYKQINIELPIFVFLTVVGAKGYQMESDRDSNFGRRENLTIDRNVLANQEILLKRYPNNVGNVLKPAFDAFRNACGFKDSKNYDENDEWNPTN
ncbi:helix-turn-helix domain-containing protein [Methanobacterium sp. SMA-27]|uniref:AlbA family DNA-binding domain-containing protein n=1 Tax=Methanobacterium sp. SMA-27 TaxID=1495336 RepID=UPI00064E6CC0|nr:ATP-binding protein [Methanobacterium sp. SMA-27]